MFVSGGREILKKKNNNRNYPTSYKQKCQKSLLFFFLNENLISCQVGGILAMMGMKVKPSALREIIEDIDEDGQQGGGSRTKYL